MFCCLECFQRCHKIVNIFHIGKKVGGMLVFVVPILTNYVVMYCSVNAVINLGWKEV